MADGHAASPNSNCGSVPSQSEKNTDPSQIGSVPASPDASNLDIVTKASPGV